MLFLLPWLFLSCIQNTVLIKTICNQYNEWIITVTHTHTRTHTHTHVRTTQAMGRRCRCDAEKAQRVDVFPFSSRFFLLFLLFLPLSLAAISGGRGGVCLGPCLLVPPPPPPPPQYSVPSQISHALPVQPSQQSQTPQLHTPFPGRRRWERKLCIELRERFHLAWPLTRFLFSHPRRLPGRERGRRTGE